MKGNKSKVLLIAVAVVVILSIIYFFQSQQASKPVSSSTIVLSSIPTGFEVNNITYNFSAYAYTTQEQEAGLMNATVTNKTFMLFAFNRSGIYSFWMKNTYDPLDIIWLNYSNSTQTANVVYFVHAQPCIDYNQSQLRCPIYTPELNANYVLESKIGFVNQSGIKNGTQIKFIFK